MKNWSVVLMVVLGAATPWAAGQDGPPAPMTPGIYVPTPELDPLQAAQADPAPSPMPPAEPAPKKETRVPTPEPVSGPVTTVQAIPSGMACPASVSCAASRSDHHTCATCQTGCQRSCCDKLKAWICHHRENTPDCCYYGALPTAPLYTWFLDYPCVEGNITVPGVITPCDCQRSCPFQNCGFGQLLGHGNLSCH